MKVSDFIAEYLVQNGIRQCFSVTGGFSMHLNDSFGQKLNVIYTHGESPAGYSAIGYSSVSYQPSVCCITSGCGATNAITPCMIAYQDSVPVFFISGQVHKDFNIRKFKSDGRDIRGYFGSDADIIRMVSSITKFSYELWDPKELVIILDQCVRNLTQKRPGPVWLSVPVDVQSMHISDEHPSKCIQLQNEPSILPQEFYHIWSNSKRPLILAGNGIHIAGCEVEFNAFIDSHNVPFVVSFFGVDLSDKYIGKVGLVGNRVGNFTIQNCDVLLCLGCRLSKSISGYNRDMFARDCKIIYVDIDDSEFINEKKTTLDICMDLRNFFQQDVPNCTIDPEWLRRTKEWKQIWGCELPSTDSDDPYPITKHIFETKSENCISVASSGSLYCVVWHMFKYKPGDRFISSGHGDMGYEVPVAIGAALHGKTVLSFVGDGSFQLNIQELQTIKTYNLPVIILYYNNGGYGAIKITQQNVFKREYGTSASCGIECPDVKKIADAYEIPYYDASDVVEYSSIRGPALVEIKCKVQERFPKLSNKIMPNGQFINCPYEDMYPFLERDVLDANMFKF